MTFRYRTILPSDQPFLWEMLYQAIYVAPGDSPPPLDIIHEPDLSIYVEGWGRTGDAGLVAVDQATNLRAGAAWLRLFPASQPAYGFVDEATPELAIALLPEYRNQGLGSELLNRLFEAARGRYPAVSLSVVPTSPAVRLYQRLGFEVMGEKAGSLVMRRPL